MLRFEAVHLVVESVLQKCLENDGHEVRQVVHEDHVQASDQVSIDRQSTG